MTDKLRDSIRKCEKVISTLEKELKNTKSSEESIAIEAAILSCEIVKASDWHDYYAHEADNEVEADPSQFKSLFDLELTDEEIIDDMRRENKDEAIKWMRRYSENSWKFRQFEKQYLSKYNNIRVIYEELVDKYYPFVLPL